MRAILVCAAMALGSSALADDRVPDHVKELFKSDDYTVTWGKPATFEPNADLEIGGGGGHAGTLGWIRFQPGRDGVDVLTIDLDVGWGPLRPQWSPDNPPVTVKHARMKSDTYTALLRDLAYVDAAVLTPTNQSSYFTSHDAWYYARVMANKKTLLKYNWAGYVSSREAINGAKPGAADLLAYLAIESLDLKKYTLTASDRAWASAKFTRDWKEFKDQDFLRWVRLRYILIIGVVGDKTAFPTLREILEGAPKDGKPANKKVDLNDNYDVRYAVCAARLILKRDGRDIPEVDEDPDDRRLKIIELLKDEK